MRTLLLHIALLYFVLLPLTTAANGPFGKVKGSVKGIDGALAGATISADSRTILSDKNGEFIFLLRPGMHSLIVSHAGYNRFVKEIKIEAQEIIIIEVVMVAVGPLEEFIVLGSRALIQRSSLTTPVPVDAFSSKLLMQTGQPGLTQMLNFSAPSLNASRELVNEPITLRGLNPDQTLILLNGFRYHNTSFLFPGPIRGILGRGTVSNDINSIPFSAIEKIEILRDGASAEYGSDAIAGVMDIRLKKSFGKTSVQFHAGQYYEGDGENISLGINRGFALNKKGMTAGFVNFSTDLRYRDHTYRGGEYKGTVYFNDLLKDDSIIRARNFDRMKVSHAGNAKLKSLALSMNGGYYINDNTEIFLTTVISKRKNYYINPYVFPKMVTLVNPDLYPDGFKSITRQHTGDISAIAGLRSETRKNWHWEFALSYGENDIDYFTDNTNNASQYFTLGKNAPTSFYTGTTIYRQLTNNLNFTKAISKKPGAFSLSNFAFGTEWRLENYEIKEGEEAAWQTYDTRKSGGAQLALFFQPSDAVKRNRNAIGVYADIEMEIKDHWLLNVAGRFEHYSDYGSNPAIKLATRYKFSDRFSLRGSVSNGFRAPSLQQRYFNATVTAPSIGGIYTSGFFRNDSEVAIAFGVSPLDAEKSINISGGFTSKLFDRIYVTVDAYWIQIKNRIVLSGIFDRSNPEVNSLFTANNLEVQRAQFFANAINTRTSGVDVVVNSSWNIKKAKLIVTLAANFTRTNLFGEIKMAENLSTNSLNTNSLFNITEEARMEKGQPADKIILSLTYRKGKTALTVRNTHFGKTATASTVTNPVDTLYEFFSSKILTDVNMNFNLKEWLTLCAGVNNIFNVYPDRFKNSRNTEDGRLIYSLEASPFGFNGGYYYVSMSFNF